MSIKESEKMRKRKAKETVALAILWRICVEEVSIIASQEIPIRGNIYCSRFVLNQRIYTNQGVSVDHILAHKITHNALYIPIIHAPINHNVIIITIVLL